MTEKSTRAAALSRQIERLDQHIHQQKQRSDRLSNYRLLTAVVGITVVSVLWFLPDWRWLFFVALIVFVGGFGYLVRQHHRVQRTLATFTIWRDTKRSHKARMALDWENIPVVRFGVRLHHPLEIDLDLRNLHRLINTATTRGGTERLREWLLPLRPDQSTVSTRQERVTELIHHPIFRDKLTLHAEVAAKDLRDSREGRSLTGWLNDEPQQAAPGWLVATLGILSAINITGFVVSALGVSSPIFTISLLGYVALFISQFHRIRDIFDDALTIEAALRRLSAVMHYLERGHYVTMPHVRELIAPLIEQQPSRRLRQANVVLAGASLRANPIFWMIFNFLVPWDYFFAFRLERLKVNLSMNVPQWLDIWHELEALSSLATFAYLNPEYTFPDVDDQSEVIFDVNRLGHPLIPDVERVSNTFRMDDVGNIVIITGSNMSGKSSFLRALGVNLCLAYAGGVVCAEAMQTIQFRLYTSIRVTDSLDDGISYFYAEVKRLRGLLDAVDRPDEPPVFFLVDEIFRGTNNRERLIGSRSFIRALVEQNAVGLIATHDLELVALADEHPGIRNHHFREDVQDNRMVFDYTLREGPSPTTNALRIMAMEGLPVEDMPEG